MHIENVFSECARFGISARCTAWKPSPPPAPRAPIQTMYGSETGETCIFLLRPMSNTLSFSNSTLLQLITITKNDRSARELTGYRRTYAPILLQTNRNNTNTLIRVASGDKRKTKIRKPLENFACASMFAIKLCTASPSHFKIESRTEYGRALSLRDLSALKSLSY